MATYIEDEQEIHKLYTEAEQEALVYQRNYSEYERLADNELIADHDESLPEINDGTLSASLYKLPKRIVSSKLKGRATSLDRDEPWVTELANIIWENKIIPNANTQASFLTKWKDAVRKAAIYGSVPVITLFVERGDYIGADFMVGQPQDVLLEPGKVSDYDSDLLFWDVYFSRQQLKEMIDIAKEENKRAKENNEPQQWDVDNLKAIYKSEIMEKRDSQRDYTEHDTEKVEKEGIKFCIPMQRGIDAPLYMYHKGLSKTVRSWTNQDPTGDVQIHLLYCYQDFKNPYGTGIVKLAGGTQNVLDYIRQADVLATQLGFRPPISITGDISDTDLDSIEYSQDALWMLGNASIKREEISNQIYSQLPNRYSQYKISLNQLIPTGDTSISSGSGDVDYSKTPQGVKFQEANLSIDDEDFKERFYECYEAVAKSMINIHFANMEGSDLLKLSDEEREILMKAGLEFPLDENGEPATNELDVIWDEARSSFDFKIEADQDKAKDDEKRLEGLMKVAELRASDPMFDQKLQLAGKRLDDGELYSEIISLTSDNKNILKDISAEDGAMMAEQQAMLSQGMDPSMASQEMQQNMPMEGMPMEEGLPMGEEMPMEQPQEMPIESNPLEEEQVMKDEAYIQDLMDSTGADLPTALAMFEAEKQGYTPEEILDALDRANQVQGEEVNYA